jgi:hypothetical protein
MRAAAMQRRNYRMAAYWYRAGLLVSANFGFQGSRPSLGVALLVESLSLRWVIAAPDDCLPANALLAFSLSDRCHCSRPVVWI